MGAGLFPTSAKSHFPFSMIYYKISFHVLSVLGIPTLCTDVRIPMVT